MITKRFSPAFSLRYHCYVHLFSLFLFVYVILPSYFALVSVDFFQTRLFVNDLVPCCWFLVGLRLVFCVCFVWFGFWFFSPGYRFDWFQIDFWSEVVRWSLNDQLWFINTSFPPCICCFLVGWHVRQPWHTFSAKTCHTLPVLVELIHFRSKQDKNDNQVETSSFNSWYYQLLRHQSTQIYNPCYCHSLHVNPVYLVCWNSDHLDSISNFTVSGSILQR